MNTTENNKLIAEFMVQNEGGLIKLSNTIYSTIDEYEIPDDHLTIKDLKYHSDWNWLMQVVEKIESLNPNLQAFFISGNRVEIKDYSVYHTLFSYYNDTNKTKIEAVYNACVEFIKFYNEQQR